MTMGNLIEWKAGISPDGPVMEAVVVFCLYLVSRETIFVK